jgi:hypothetical protein
MKRAAEFFALCVGCYSYYVASSVGLPLPLAFFVSMLLWICFVLLIHFAYGPDETIND